MDLDAVAVVFDLVNPLVARWRLGAGRSQRVLDEAWRLFQLRARQVACEQEGLERLAGAACTAPVLTRQLAGSGPPRMRFRLGSRTAERGNASGRPSDGKSAFSIDLMAYKSSLKEGAPPLRRQRALMQLLTRVKIELESSRRALVPSKSRSWDSRIKI